MLEMDAIALLRLGYIVATLLVLVIYALPALRSRFLDYGARAATSKSSDTSSNKIHPEKNALLGALDALASWRVPHSWFTSFYAFSTICSLVWGAEILIQGPLFSVIAQNNTERTSSMTVRQVGIGWALMLAQGSRRLYECVTLSRESQSKMWIGHWLIGILFYLGTGIAIWIEGTPALLKHTYSIQDMTITPPDFRTFVSILLFILASGFQHDCHEYLASLKSRAPKDAKQSTGPGYQLPKHPAFNLSLTPHYFAECLIYFALTILTTPAGQWCNPTVACALVFTVTNLGLTAIGTKRWYEQRFGSEVKGRARMIPFVF